MPSLKPITVFIASIFANENTPNYSLLNECSSYLCFRIIPLPELEDFVYGEKKAKPRNLSFETFQERTTRTQLRIGRVANWIALVLGLGSFILSLFISRGGS
jgi:hypothetical protein